MAGLNAGDPLLAQVRRADLIAYLKAIGWEMVGSLGTTAEVWAGSDPDSPRVPLPADESYADYPLRVAQLLEVLESETGISTGRALDHLVRARWDVVSLRWIGFEDGTMPLNSAEEAFAAIRDMFLAAACSAVNPRLVHPNRKPADAMTYVDSVRIGQTERGSYVINALSPLPSGQAPTMFDDINVPFSRKVLASLASGLREMHSLTGTESVDEKDRLLATAERGVSANLLEAVTTMVQVQGSSGTDMRFMWSPRMRQADQVGVVTFSQKQLPVLRHAASVFRRIEPMEEFHLRGKVVRLRRDEGERVGNVGVRGWVGAGIRSVSIELPDAWYQVAVRAHAQDLLIQAVGQLRRERNRYSLVSVVAFEVLEGEQAEADEEPSDEDNQADTMGA